MGSHLANNPLTPCPSPTGRGELAAQPLVYGGGHETAVLNGVDH